MWTKFLEKLPDVVTQFFGLIDKNITDKDEALKRKIEFLSIISGKDSKYWLPANAFTIMILSLFYIVCYLVIMGKSVPSACLWILGAYMLGPLLNNLSKETLGKLSEIIKLWITEYNEYRKEHKKEEK